MTFPPEIKMPDIVIDRHGDWYTDGVKIIHEKIFQLFNKSLRKDANGGYFIQIGEQTCPVRVEHTPFTVRSLFFENNDQGRDILWLVLNDGRQEPLVPDTLQAVSEQDVRCLVSGDFEAWFCPLALTQLGSFIKQNDDGMYHVVINGDCFPIKPAVKS
jgi:hypothetical protein